MLVKICVMFRTWCFCVEDKLSSVKLFDWLFAQPACVLCTQCVSLSVRGQLVKMLIILEPPGKFWSNYLYLCISTLSIHWHT